MLLYGGIYLVDCQYSNWSETTCDKPCGGGVMKRYRHILHETSTHSQACDAIEHEEVSCNQHPCHEDDWIPEESADDTPAHSTSGPTIGLSLALVTMFAVLLAQWIYYKKKGRLPCYCCGNRDGDKDGSPPPAYSLTKILSSSNSPPE